MRLILPSFERSWSSRTPSPVAASFGAGAHRSKWGNTVNDLDGGRRPTQASQERVVLVHCSASTARQWKTLASELVGFQPVSLDLYGHGNRGHWGGSGPLSLSVEAAAIGDACGDGTPFHLVGHSYGGGVALRFASERPERLLSLTLIEPCCFHLLKAADGGGEHLLGEVLAVADAVNRGVICGDYRGGMETFIDYWSGTGTWTNLAEDRKTQLADLAVHVAHHFWGAIYEDSSLAAYRAVDVPTLILCGTHSPRPSRAITRLLADALPRVRHRTIRNAGHMSPLTHSAVVNPLILQHLLINGTQDGVPDTTQDNQPFCAGGDLATKTPWLADAVSAPETNCARPS